MIEKHLPELFPMKMFIRDDGEYWNGKPDKWSNLSWSPQMTQRFGQNLMNYKQFGMIGHNGIDIASGIGCPIVAPCKMWITYTNNSDEGYGCHIFGETESKELFGEHAKLEIVFGHLKAGGILTAKGRWVEQGELIGLMGNTGYSSGSHTHFGIRPYTEYQGKWNQFYGGSGYAGYIDPEPFLPHIVWNWNECIREELIIKNMLEQNEKKIVIEGQGKGRKAIIINGKLREIKEGREADACLYTLANNNLGETITTELFDKLPKGEVF